MLQIGTTTNAYTLPPPLVNTTTPGTSVTHVPYDNVAPSVSSAQVDNNAKGNSEATASTAYQIAADAQSANDSIAALSNNSATLSATAQAPFIAQVAAQDDTQETLAVLAKLVEYSNVKYKPSNAMKPTDAPSGVFGRILASERSTPAVSPKTTKPAAVTQTTVPKETQAAPKAQTADHTTTLPTQAVNAYATGATRVTTQSDASTKELA